MSDLILIISKRHFSRKAYDAENALLICNVQQITANNQVDMISVRNSTLPLVSLLWWENPNMTAHSLENDITAFFLDLFPKSFFFSGSILLLKRRESFPYFLFRHTYFFSLFSNSPLNRLEGRRRPHLICCETKLRHTLFLNCLLSDQNSKT